MNAVPGLSLYNPNQDRFDDDCFVEDFVARHEEVEVLLNVLRRAASGGETEQMVMVGARGMGKTSLLRRLAIAIGRDAKLRAAFIPLRFREEQYNVISLDVFWRNCGEALAEWCDANGHEALADELDEATDSPEWRDANRAAEEFLEFCERIGSRACLLIDNLDLILDAMGNEGWSLRQVLQRDNGPVIVGAATHLLKAGAERDGPFYEFFHPIFLEALTEAELLRCMLALADRRGEAGSKVKAVLASTPERVRTLYALTGGNPRVLSLIYQMFERAETDGIFADLEALLDQVTPYYKARIEEYPGAQQRALIDAIALNWDPITSSALAEVTGIEVTTISSQLTRLRRDGFVEQVPTSGARDGYQLAERFLNIWYLMRHGTRKTRQRLRWLTIFLTKLFSVEELSEMAAEARDTARCARWHPDFREAVIEAYDSAQSEVRESIEIGFADNKLAPDVPDAEASKARTLLVRIREHLTGSQYEMAVAACDELVGRFGTSSQLGLKKAVATALSTKAFALHEMGRAEEQVSIFDEVVTRFGHVPEPPLREYVAKALVNKGTVLRQLDRGQEAIAAYDQVVVRFSDAAELSLLEQVAKAGVNKAFALGELGRSEEEIAACDEVVVRFGDAAEPPLQEQVARALITKGTALWQLGRYDECLQSAEDFLHRFSDLSGSHLQQQVAYSHLIKASALAGLGHLEEAVATIEKVVRRFGDVTDESLQDPVASAQLVSGAALEELGRNEEAIEVYDNLVGRFSGSSKPSLKELLAKALVNKGAALCQLGRSEEAIAVYDEVAARFDDPTEPALREQVAMALVNKGVRLGQLGRGEEAIAVYHEVTARFGDAAETSIQALAADALGNAGRLLFHALGDSRRAEDCYHKALAIRERLTDSANLVWAMIAQRRPEDAMRQRDALPEIDPEGLALINAGIEIVRDNVGAATEQLGVALERGLQPEASNYFEDILWFLRIGVDQGHGEKLIEWFESSGNAERYAPIYGALVARVRGERFLNDLNPEVRRTAREFHKVLAVTAGCAEKPLRKRARRPRRRRG